MALLPTIMSAHGRALITGMAGPTVQAIGLAWETVHLFTSHTAFNVNARHLAFEPAVLVIVVGFLVSLVCVPTAIEIARASEQELKLPHLGAEESTQPRGRRAARGWSR
jgi:hypothetical protein